VRLFLSAFGEEHGEIFGVIGHVERVALHGCFVRIAEMGTWMTA
jgi:hypothetical protein